MVTLKIDGKLPNLNDYTKACRANRYAGAEMKRKAEEILLFYKTSKKSTLSLKLTSPALQWAGKGGGRDESNSDDIGKVG